MNAIASGAALSTMKSGALLARSRRRAHRTGSGRSGKFQSCSRHLGRVRREPQHIVGAVRAAAFEPAPSLKLRESACAAARAARSSAVMSSPSRPGPTNRPSRSRCPGNRRCCCRPGCCRPRRRQGSAARPAPAAGGEKIASKLPPRGNDAGIVGRTFDAAIHAQIEVGPVAIVFAVGFVVLALVADKIGKREAVMHGDVVDARARACGDGARRCRRSRSSASPPRRSDCPRRVQ